MGLLRNRALWAALLGVLLSGLFLLLGVGYLGLVVYSGLAGGAPLVETLLGVAVPALLGIGLLVVLLVTSCVALLYVLVRNASLPRSDRLASLAGRLEREYPPLRAVGLPDLLAPPEPSAEERAERALADLKRQYVEGEITEAEFERRVDRLVSNETVDEARAARERKRVVGDRSDGY